MAAAHSWRSSSYPGAFRLALTRACLLGVPVFLLAGAVGRSSGPSFWILGCGTVCQAVLCLLSLRPKQVRTAASPTYILHYLLALAWFWIGAGQEQHWYPYVAQAVLLVIPLCIFARQSLYSTGAATQRRAEYLASRLAGRSKWPLDLSEIRTWPEVKAFREALYLDATPALKLLEHPRFEVHFAALVALEFHKNWRAGQAERVLKAAADADEEDVRAAAVLATANVEDRFLVENVANYLADPAPKVRRAASEALLWDLENRWSWIRHAVRKALANPEATGDSVGVFAYLALPSAAVDDMISWTTEKGLLAQRAATVLAGYYNQAAGSRQRRRRLSKALPGHRSHQAGAGIADRAGPRALRPAATEPRSRPGDAQCRQFGSLATDRGRIAPPTIAIRSGQTDVARPGAHSEPGAGAVDGARGSAVHGSGSGPDALRAAARPEYAPGPRRGHSAHALVGSTNGSRKPGPGAGNKIAPIQSRADGVSIRALLGRNLRLLLSRLGRAFLPTRHARPEDAELLQQRLSAR